LTTRDTADAIDARLLLAMNRDPRAATIALADEVGVSRNTVQARLNKWTRSNALTTFDRCIDPAFLGYPLRAFVLTRVRSSRSSRRTPTIRTAWRSSTNRLGT
jgi:DNA-binding Lrp family transcriptional regulator